MRPVLAAILAPLLTVAVTLRTSAEPEPDVVFASSTDTVACYEFVEVAIHGAALDTAGPASTVLINGTFGLRGQEPIAVAGFRDAADGSVHRIRFMPSSPGQYEFTVRYREGGFTRTHEGTFVATDARAKGIVRADPHFPGALLWDGSKERFFWSGLEAGGLLHLEPAVLQARLEQLDRCRITGLRIVVAATTDEFDTWAHVERLLELARARHMVVTIALPDFSVGGGGTALAQRLAYTAARLAAFNNVIWELPASDGAALAAIRDADPYRHLTQEPAPSLALEAGTHDANTRATTMNMAWQRALEGSTSTLRLPDSKELAAGDAIEEVLAPVGHLYDFFTGMPWWELHPEPALLVALRPHGSRTGAPEPNAWAARNKEGDLAAIYVAGGGVVTVSDAMLRDQLKPLWFSPRDGGMRNARALRDRVYRTPTADDWVLLFRTPCNCSFRDFDNEFE